MFLLPRRFFVGRRFVSVDQSLGGLNRRIPSGRFVAASFVSFAGLDRLGQQFAYPGGFEYCNGHGRAVAVVVFSGRFGFQGIENADHFFGRWRGGFDEPR